MVKRYVVCKMAIVLLPPFFLPNKTNNCKGDWVGVANLTKHCLTISPNELKALLRRKAMSLNACWSRPIAVLDPKERQAFRTFSTVNPDCQPIHGLLQMFFTQCTNAVYLLVETDCVFATPLTFPCMGVTFRHTLRVSREISLTVPDHQC